MIPDAVPWLISAKSEAALRDQAARLASFVATTDARPVDIGYSLATARAHLPYRASVAGTDRADLAAKLSAIAGGATAERTGASPSCSPGRARSAWAWAASCTACCRPSPRSSTRCARLSRDGCRAR
ncbi:hypothetical protein Pflav_008140 [Phytohabitans flavus]|uniref:RhiE-like KS-MAT linker domain-containing protein n=1 Tax=Phytohabitans flavus TaxID=1076124 RepID=A0A6F8XKQ8_9ACTN|nr:hypothetical protein Pflav_008140 [Phytohabitans flavus]